MTHINPKKEDWEEEFHKFKFQWDCKDVDSKTCQGYEGCSEGEYRPEVEEELKSFISRLLAEARREQHRLAVTAGKSREKKWLEENAHMVDEDRRRCVLLGFDLALSALDRVKPEV